MNKQLNWPGTPQHYWPEYQAQLLRESIDALRETVLKKAESPGYPQLAAAINSLTNILSNGKEEAILLAVQSIHQILVDAPLQIKGDQSIVLSPSADSLLTPPAGATKAVIQNNGCDVWFRFGASPISDFYTQWDSNTWELSNPGELTSVRIRAAAGQTGKLFITYYG